MKTQKVTFTAGGLAERADAAYTSMSMLAASMKDMAFLSGALTVCDTVTSIEEAARFAKFEEHGLPPPPRRLDMATLAYVGEVLKARSVMCAQGLTVQADAPPSGEGAPH